jgi:hypothetical protein
LGLNGDGTTKSTNGGSTTIFTPPADTPGAAAGDAGTMTGVEAYQQQIANMGEVWDKLNKDQQDVFTRHFTRNKGRAPDGAEALTDFARSDIYQFEQTLKVHLSGIPVGDPGGPPVGGDGAEAGIFAQPDIAEAAPVERLTAGQKQHFADYRAALDAGYNQSDPEFGGNATLMIAAHKAQERSEQRETERERIEFELNPDITGGPQLGRGLGREMMKGGLGRDVIGGGPPMPDISLSPTLTSATSGGHPMPGGLTGYSAGTTFRDIERALGLEPRAGGGTVRPGEITVVGEKGPEIAMMPPGTHILPLGRATKQDIRAAQSTGRAYQGGGTINFGELPFGLRQLQAGRPITPSRGYLSQAAGLNLPSAQAFQNITPESRDVFLDLAAQAGIPRKSFAQELASTIPSGRRMPVARIAPISRRGIQ